MGNNGSCIVRNKPYDQTCWQPANDPGQHVVAGDVFVEGTTAFKIPAKLVRSTDSDVIDYVRWFKIDLSPKMLELWSTTSWLIRQARRCRPIEMHTYRLCDAQERILNFRIICNCCDARSNDYHMSEVTGMDYRAMR